MPLASHVESMPDAVILCGGQGSRMAGADKGLLLRDGMPLYQQVLTQLRREALGQIMISANRNQAAYRASGCVVLGDLRGGYPGPLAGIEAALLHSRADWLLVLPCDVPQLPADLLPRLWAARRQAPLVRAVAAGRVQPLHCLLHRRLLPGLQMALDAGHHAVRRWQDEAGVAELHFADPFANLNDAAALLNETRHEPSTDTAD